MKNSCYYDSFVILFDFFAFFRRETKTIISNISYRIELWNGAMVWNYCHNILLSSRKKAGKIFNEDDDFTGSSQALHRLSHDFRRLDGIFAPAVIGPKILSLITPSTWGRWCFVWDTHAEADLQIRQTNA